MSDVCVVSHVTFRMMQVTFFSTEAAQSEAPLLVRLFLQPLMCINPGVLLKHPATTGLPLSSAGLAHLASFFPPFNPLAATPPSTFQRATLASPFQTSNAS
jgi:hypothetical protein